METRQYTIQRHNRQLDERTPSLLVNQYLWKDNNYCPEVQVRAAYSDAGLRLQFRVYEAKPLVTYNKLNDPVYKDSCVEFFWQPAPDDDSRYLNFEFNAAGTMLLGFGESVESRSRLEVDPGLFQIRTTVDNEEHFAFMSRTFWTLEFRIPFDWLKERFPSFQAESGRIMRGNFYKCGDKTEEEHYGCWNLVTSALPNFHRPQDFGILIFE